MIDTHTHLYFPEFDEDIDEIISKSLCSGISHFILPNVDAESLPLMKKFHSRYNSHTSMALGLHPTEVKEGWEKFVDEMDKELSSGDYVAIGEVGIDLYWEKEKIKLQKEAFERQLIIAEKNKLPVIIHSRDAFDETIEVIGKVNPTVPLIFHSFTGDVEDVDKIRKKCDPFFGINGVVTYKNAKGLRDSLKTIGLNRILLETDSPYLTPVQHRGKRNESTYIVHVRDKIAETLEISPSEVETITDLNARSIFRI